MKVESEIYIYFITNLLMNFSTNVYVAEQTISSAWNMFPFIYSARYGAKFSKFLIPKVFESSNFKNSNIPNMYQNS